MNDTGDVTRPEEPLRLASMDAPHPGERIGRYEVLGKAGAGAMGVVYRAHDPDLQREIAIKLVLPEHIGGVGGVEHRTRLFREARALAQLAHPNVVRVYDVGEQGEGVFVAMEFIVGTDASQWLGDEQRSWPQILAAYRAAGRGLAAAHAAGLVHRDFKPANILVGSDHRVRVTDFGLATPRTNPGSWPSRSTATTGRVASESTGTPIVGTPSYMAPDQLMGEPADAASDQYAFCCSLWEALFGQRPFAETDAFTMQQAKARDVLRPPPIDTGVPVALVDALRRGLRADPRARFADMAALLTQLRIVAHGGKLSAPASPRLRWLPSVALGAALVVAGATLVGPLVGVDPCLSNPVAEDLRSSYSDAVGGGHRNAALRIARALAGYWDERGCEPLTREWTAIAAP